MLVDGTLGEFDNAAVGIGELTFCYLPSHDGLQFPAPPQPVVIGALVDGDRGFEITAIDLHAHVPFARIDLLALGSDPMVDLFWLYRIVARSGSIVSSPTTL